MADTSRNSAALIEDFFTVNETRIDTQASLNFEMYEVSFCIEGPSVIDFALASSDIDAKDYKLVINNVTVAEAAFSDFDQPSNLSILYRGRITEDSQV